MSSFYRQSKHPETGKWSWALHADDHFGSHEYGIKFEGDPVYYRPDKIETREATEEESAELEKMLHPPKRVSDLSFQQQLETDRQSKLNQELQFQQQVEHDKKNIMSDDGFIWIEPSTINSMMIAQRADTIKEARKAAILEAIEIVKNPNLNRVDVRESLKKLII